MRTVGDFPFSFTLNWEVVALGFEELIDVLLLCSRQSRHLQSCLPLSDGGKRFSRRKILQSVQVLRCLPLLGAGNVLME